MSTHKAETRDTHPRLYLNHGTPQRLVVEFPDCKTTVTASTSMPAVEEDVPEESVLKSQDGCEGLSLEESGSVEAVAYAKNTLLMDGLPPPHTLTATQLCAIRLHQVSNLVANEDIRKEDVMSNLQYAISVLETLYTEETRRLCSEDDGLDEVKPDAVPSEVRDWLTQTFTRVHASPRPRADRFRFKSVAQALTAGLLVDKLYRRVSSANLEVLSPPVMKVLQTTDRWNFNVFELQKVSDGHALRCIGHDLMRKRNIMNRFKIRSSSLDAFLMAIEKGYSKYQNPYHNLIHGADVAQTSFQILSSSYLLESMSDIEIFATLFAALIHDYEHTGTTNNFHIKTRSDLAQLYNDRSVLENHHVSSVFRLMNEEVTADILEGLKSDEYLEFRELVIEMVLSTDMSCHFQQMKTLKSLLSCPENIERSKALSMVIHTSDISHAAKEWSLHSNWTERLMEEFFKQGDREKELGLPCSPLCDRNTTMIGQSQIGFINFILEPTFTVLGNMLDELAPAPPNASKTPADDAEEKPAKPRVDKPWVKHLEENKNTWQELADQVNGSAEVKEAGTAKDGTTKDGPACETGHNGKEAEDASSKRDRRSMLGKGQLSTLNEEDQ